MLHRMNHKLSANERLIPNRSRSKTPSFAKILAYEEAVGTQGIDDRWIVGIYRNKAGTTCCQRASPRSIFAYENSAINNGIYDVGCRFADCDPAPCRVSIFASATW